MTTEIKVVSPETILYVSLHRLLNFQKCSVRHVRINFSYLPERLLSRRQTDVFSSSVQLIKDYLEVSLNLKSVFKGIIVRIGFVQIYMYLENKAN